MQHPFMETCWDALSCCDARFIQLAPVKPQHLQIAVMCQWEKHKISKSWSYVCRWAAVADDDWPQQQVQRDVMLADFDLKSGFGDR